MIHAPLRFRALAALAAISLAACSDAAVVPVIGRTADGAFPLGVSQPVDHEINSSDTWVTYDASRQQITYVSLAEPVVDAATAQSENELTLAQPAQTLHTEAGYDAYGTVRVNEYRQPPTRDPYEEPVDETRRIQVSGDQVTSYSADGEVTVAAHESDVSSAPLAELGSLAGAQVTAGVIVDRQEIERVTVEGGSAYRLSMMEAPGGSTRVERLPNGRVLMTTVTSAVIPGPAAAPGAARDSIGREETTVGRRFALRGEKYVLERVEVETRATTARGRMTVRETTDFRNVTWSVNPRKDAERRAIRERARTAANSAAPVARMQDVDHCPVDDPTCTPYDPGDDTGDGGAGPGPNYEACENADPNERNVVFQHGIFSNGAVWERMRAWMHRDFYLGCTPAWSLNSEDRLAYQAGDLRGRLWETNRLGWVLIGHSQGGLISRYVAQRTGGLVHGVITVGTPHHGAPITRTSQTAVTAGLLGVAALTSTGCSSLNSFGCPRILEWMSLGVPMLASFALSLNTPAFTDLKPGSGFQAELNAQPEAFRRVGIQHFPKKLFVEWRLYGDYFDAPDGFKGGRRQVKRAETTFVVNTACGVAGWLLGYTAGAQRCVTRAGGMLATTLLWNFMTARLGKTDGIVPGSSQIYPNAEENYNIPKGDSHVGEAKSEHTRARLRSALSTYMAVERKDTW